MYTQAVEVHPQLLIPVKWWWQLLGTKNSLIIQIQPIITSFKATCLFLKLTVHTCAGAAVYGIIPKMDQKLETPVILKSFNSSIDASGGKLKLKECEDVQGVRG